MEAEIYEAAPELTEIGAAIAQSANATRLFRRLGILDEYAKYATTPTELIYRDGHDGHRIAAHPVGKDSWYSDRFGAPYYGIHRADLQRVLGNAVRQPTGCTWAVSSSTSRRSSDSVQLEFANGRVEHADLVIGADGDPLHGPALGHRRERRRLLGNQRLPRDRADRRVSRRCPTRKPSSSGWALTHISCTSPSAGTPST